MSLKEIIGSSLQNTNGNMGQPITTDVLYQFIDRAAQEKWAELCLSDYQLSILPAEIGHLTCLKKLDLSGNLIRKLPTEIGNLTNLTKLDLRSNQLIELPPEIGQLTKLKDLDLSDNKLNVLPPEIGQLSQLKKLQLANNQLKDLSPPLFRFKDLRELDLSDNQLRGLPPEIGKLTHLTQLDVSDNQIRQLPPEIAELNNLTRIGLSRNEICVLPPEIGQLINLKTLYLRRNQLKELPEEIGQLVNLSLLLLEGNYLRTLPPEIGQLTNLTILYLSNNQLENLPPEIGSLTKLKGLGLHGNLLNRMPANLGLLKNLRELSVDDDSFVFPPPEIVSQGSDAILSYLREQLEGSLREYVSKLIIVGEGGVGKTSVLRALCNEIFDPQLPTTHGIELRSLDLAHPTDKEVTMQLNCWDFGGQQIYHATHQFFLTNRSLFVLVWNTRHGYEQGKLYYWLDTIQALAPDSPVLIVATHIDERDADLPLSSLRTEYPQIFGHYEVSNLTGEAIETLQTAVAKAASTLPLMGEIWPESWLKSAESIRKKEEKFITPQESLSVFNSHNVSSEDAQVLIRWLHELGDILFYWDDEELNDILVLKPQWVAEYISKVLESKTVIGKLGIFTRTHMNEIWHDLNPAMRDHFLRLMERFDLSYRTLENRDISLVVERLPLDPPDFSSQWDGIREENTCREIAMKFRLNTIPAGIPTWFIARSHRFTTYTHWRTGALLADRSERKHLGLVQTFPHERYVQLIVRGPNPHNFFALLKDGFELTLRRFPGLKIERLVPCSGHNGNWCEYEFNYEYLQKAIERKPPVLQIQCPACFEHVSVPGLLFGLHWRTQDEVLDRIDSMQKAIVSRQDNIWEELTNLRELSQREFTNIFRREQSKIDSHCPNIFVLRPKDSSGWIKAIAGQKIELKLYCQAPGCWHPTEKGGLYEIDDPANWVKLVAPFLRRMIAVLKFAAPLAGPWLAFSWPEYEKLFNNDLRLMSELVKKLPDLKKDRTLEVTEEIGQQDDPQTGSGTALRALRHLLNEKDPHHHWGDLKKVLTPEGHYLWLCQQHAEDYIN